MKTVAPQKAQATIYMAACCKALSAFIEGERG